MSTPGPKNIHEKKHAKWDRATFKKAVISNVNTNNFTADVYFAENPQTVVRGVPFSSSIVPWTVNVGDRCRVDVFDEANPLDMAVAYIYGRKITYPRLAYGSGQINALASNAVVIPHGLPGTPQVYSAALDGFPYYGPTNTTYVASCSVDATNITITRIPNNTITVTYYWFAILY
jgi:hypothetical protein